MADLGLGAQVGLAVCSGGFALMGVVLSQALSRRSRRAEFEHEERRDARRQVLASYADCLALATEFDSRLDLFTPPPHTLGAYGANSALIEKFRELSDATGQQLPDLEALGRDPLVGASVLPGLKDLLARVTASASTVQIVGSAAASTAAQELVPAQRYWLLSLERDDPVAAAEGLITARPSLQEFRQVLANDFRLDPPRASGSST